MRGKRFRRREATVAQAMKGTLNQKMAIKLLKEKRLDAGSRRQAPGQDDQGGRTGRSRFRNTRDATTSPA